MSHLSGGRKQPQKRTGRGQRRSTGCSGSQRAPEGAPALPCARTAPPAAQGYIPPLILLEKKPNPNATKNLTRALPDPHTAVPEQGVEGMVTPTETARSKRRREKATRRLALDSSDLSSESSRERRGTPSRRGRGARRQEEAGAGGAAGGAVGCHGFRLQRTGHGGKISGCDLGVLPCDSLDWLHLDPGQQLLDKLLHRHHLLRRAQSPSLQRSSRAMPCPKHGGTKAVQPPRSESGNKHTSCGFWTQQCPCPA